MPLLDRIPHKLEGMPKFTNAEDFNLALECLAFVVTHMEEHGYVPNCIWLDDIQYKEYTSLYPDPSAQPKFFGIPVKANKNA